MENLTLDIFKIAVPVIAGIVGWLWKKILNMSERIVVMETNMMTCKTNMNDDMVALKEKMNSERDAIQKTIEKIQQRQDSHSKKQDEILVLITDFKFEVIKQIGELSSDLKALNSTLEVWDSGAKFNKNKKK